jgi:hypothetical protein
MTRQISFVMHPEDERAFLSELTAAPGWLVAASADAASWRTLSTEALGALACEVVYVTRSEWLDSVAGAAAAAIQFWRSRLAGDVLTQGRLAVVESPANSGGAPGAAAAATREFGRLRSRIQQHYANGLLLWQHEDQSRDLSDGRADARTWVGPVARAWLAEASSRSIKQSVEARVSARPVRAAI